MAQARDQHLAQPLLHDSGVVPKTEAAAERPFPQYAEEQQDLEAAGTLQKVHSRLSELTNDQSDNLIRQLSRRSTHRSKITGMADAEDGESDEFSDLLAEIFDV